MTDKKKKLAAALGAVSLYLKQEADAAEQQLVVVEPEMAGFGQWAHSGRQEMMALRRLIQMRTFTRF